MSKVEQIAKLLMCNAYELYRATLIGSPPPRIDALHRELRSPKPGDLVMEITSQNHERPLERIGRLLWTGNAPWINDDEWDVNGYSEINLPPMRRVWDIQLVFDGNRPFRWENAEFIKVLEGRFEMPN